MTKRMLAIVCLLALLLTACTAAPAVSNSPAPPGTAQAPSGSEAPRPSASEQETEPSVPTESVHSVTAGGFTVHTDYSGYTAYQPPQEKYIRPAGVDLQAFHPENAHGRVYPYVTDLLYTSSEYGYSWEGGRHCGFVDETGTLVTDGIYTDINAITRYDYIHPEIDYLPLWLVSRTGEVTLEHVTGDGFSYDYPVGPTLYGVVAMDGSFSIPCEYRGIQVAEDKLICIRSWEESDYVVYDLQGNLLLTSDQLIDRPCDSFNLSYSEGYYTLSYYHYNDSDEGNEIFYADETGKKVLGPYSEGMDFHEGLAQVSMDGGTSYGFIDKSGTWIIPAQFRYCDDFYHGLTEGKLWSGANVVMDRQGTVLVETYGDGYFNETACGLSYYCYGQISFYDRSGKLLMDEEGDWSCLDENTFALTRDDGLILRNLAEDREILVPGMNYGSADAAIIDGQMVWGYRCGDYMTDREVFVTKDLGSILELEREQVPMSMGYDDFYATRDQMTGASYYLWYYDHAWSIWDADGNRMGSTKESYPQILGGMIYSGSGLACTYHSFDGQLIFSYPLQGGGD